MGLIFHPFNHPCHFLLDGLHSHHIPPPGWGLWANWKKGPHDLRSRSFPPPSLLAGLPCSPWPWEAHSQGSVQAQLLSFMTQLELFLSLTWMISMIKKSLKSRHLLWAGSHCFLSPCPSVSLPQPHLGLRPPSSMGPWEQASSQLSCWPSYPGKPLKSQLWK